MFLNKQKTEHIFSNIFLFFSIDKRTIVRYNQAIQTNVCVENWRKYYGNYLL